MKRQCLLAIICLLVVNVASGQQMMSLEEALNNSSLKIDNTGIVDSKTKKTKTLEQARNEPTKLDRTGIVTSRTQFGQTIRYKNGYFRGDVENGVRRGGTIYFNSGQRQSCATFDSKGRLHGQVLIDYANGNWTICHYTHGVRNGEGSYYKNGKYYDGVWKDGKQVSSNKVSTPKYGRQIWDAPSGVYETDAFSTSNKKSSGTSKLKSTAHQCKVCHGTGTIVKEQAVGTYGMSSSKKKCPTCGKTIISGTAHTHVKCKYCNGTGVIK